ncbi:RecF/RecN/SMC [Entophlyctis helioformis]|nr:RecF/RecN/SMC [Entophlyctis helioformis]
MGHLVLLEVENFKSYKGRQSIGPFFNFTAVIGPNGSGKSNLMDAISFVLGVKSAQLRSVQLRDLVYRPTSGDRNADAGTGTGTDADADADADAFGVDGPIPKTAHVTAVYETSAKQQIRFTRTINANGTSDYRIGNTTVTYSKYLAALKKENILVKARNFLVFQGDVEAVASQSPKDLTRLIEQISGSLDLKEDYERLKAAMELATENSALTFNKKRTVNAEMKQFREQRQEAERFRELVEKRDKAVLTHHLWKLFHLDKGIEKMQETLAREKRSTAAFETQQAEVRSRLRTETKTLAKTQKKVLDVERSIKQAERDKDDINPGMLRVDEQIRHSTKKRTKAAKAVSATTAELDAQTQLVHTLEADLARLNRALEQYEEEARVSADKQGRSLGSAQVREYTAKRAEADTRTFAERQSLSVLQVQLQTAAEARKRLVERHEEQNVRETILSEERKTLESRRAKLVAEMESTEEELNAARKRLVQMDTDLRRLNQDNGELNEKLGMISSRLMQARADRHESDRSQKLTQTIDALKRLFPGVHGRLFDLCKTTQNKYNQAVSVVLGKNMDAIVVDSQKIAIQCIKYMREQRSGQATFLPLDTIQTKPINEKYRSFAAGARLAMDVIQYDSIAERAVLYACGNALVCESMQVARYICYERKQEVKAVTLDGTVIHKTGMITGGRSEASSSSGRRWEEKELAELKRSRDEIVARLNEIQKERLRASHDDHVRSEITAYGARLASMADDLAAVNLRLKSIATELGSVQELVVRLAADLDTATAAETAIREQVDAIDRSVRDVERQVFGDFCERIGVASIREYEDSQLKTSQETAERRLQFQTQQAKLENQILFERQRLDELSKRVAAIQDTLTADNAVLAAFNATKQGLATQLAEIDARLALLHGNLAETQAAFNAQLAVVAGVKAELADVSKAFDSVIKAIELRDADIEKSHAERLLLLRKCKMEEIDLPLVGTTMEEVSLEDLSPTTTSADDMDVDQPAGSSSGGGGGRKRASSTHVQLQVNYATLKRVYREHGGDDTDVEFQSEIKDLTAEIDRLGPSLRAAERKDDVESKLRDTSDEFEQARQAAKEAKDEFQAIKSKRYELFHAAYTHIESVIDGIYKELTMSPSFTVGGTAYLSLEDSEEPYLDGVKYHAMPPMKRFREMEQLSGGEKTVAALALLFAIHSFRPAPFFVLDEVDAALDNTNVARVTQYIRTHASADMQFVVISLKPGFYEHAESLVGVYRDQSARSSRVLTMDLGMFEE